MSDRFTVVEIPTDHRPRYGVQDQALTVPVVLFTCHDFRAAEWLAEAMCKADLPAVFDLPLHPSKEPF